jgi:predicted Fe-S protein YdhL (DUF1289 family)
MNPSGRPRSEAPAAQREGSGAGPDAAAVDVASPCVSLCEMSRHNAFCVGCFRTLDEIASWSVLDAQATRAIGVPRDAPGGCRWRKRVEPSRTRAQGPRER